MNYYLYLFEETKGPYTIAEVEHMREGGYITDETLFCEQGAEKWFPVEALKSHFKKPVEVKMETPVASKGTGLFFVADGTRNNERGPFTMNQLRGMWSMGSITANDTMREDGTQAWFVVKSSIAMLEKKPVTGSTKLLAVVLTLILPGLGHFILGETTKGAIALIFFILFTVTSMFLPGAFVIAALIYIFAFIGVVVHQDAD